MQCAVFHSFASELSKEAGFLSGAGQVLKEHLHPGVALRETASALKGLAIRPGKTLGEGVKHIKSMGTGEKVLMGGGLAVGGYADATTKKDPGTGRHVGVGERLGRAGAGLATGLATTRAGLLGSVAAGVGGGAVGARIGRAVDRGVARVRGTT